MKNVSFVDEKAEVHMKNIEAQIPPEGYYQRKFVKKYDPVDNIPHQSDLVDKALLDLYDKDNEFLAQKNI